VTALAAEPEIIGVQRPRLASIPRSCSHAFGEQTVELARKSGLILDDWQAWGLIRSMGTREDGHWSAFEVCWICARQNGKNAVLEARQLGGLYVIREELQIHTAHEFKACSEHFRRIETIIRGNDSLLRKVKRNGIRTSHGEEAIELRAEPSLVFGHRGTQIRRSIAPRLRFLARSRGSGRSFTADAVYYDEAMILAQEDVDASMPTMSAVPNSQMWFAGSAGFPDSTQLSSVRDRGIAGTDPTLVFLEWSCEFCPDLCPDKKAPRCRFGHDRRDDPHSWARANPGFNIRISQEHVGREFIKMATSGFDRERLGIGDWPAGDLSFAVIPQHDWDACAWPGPGEMPRPRRIALSVDIVPDQSAATIAIAGLLPQEPAGEDGVLPERACTLEIGSDGTWDDHRAGVDWILPRLRELAASNKVIAIVIDPVGPGAELITSLEIAGFAQKAAGSASAKSLLVTCQLRDVTQAHAQFLRGLGVPPPPQNDLPGSAAAPPRTIWHRDQPDMRRAVAAAVQRDVGDGQHAWARRDTTEDISPLCAGTMAVWAARKFGRGYDVLKSVL
jgi:hypothetical protein